MIFIIMVYLIRIRVSSEAVLLGFKLLDLVRVEAFELGGKEVGLCVLVLIVVLGHFKRLV
jgi:hypothetical protein